MSSLQLDDLLVPTSPAAFFLESWEKQPLIVARGDKSHYAGLLALRDIDNVIAFSKPKFTDQNAFRSSAISPPTYVRGLLADQAAMAPVTNPGIAELRQVFDQSKSIVIMGMQQRWPPVAQMCRNLEAVFHCPVHANLYLTPPESQGFAAHYDPHEVFILQLEGVKQWRLYDRGEQLPLASDRVGMPKLPLGPAREVRLEAGDLLYIPRGHVHEASTAESYSLHLTVGINVFRWSDLLHHALTIVARMDPRFRASIAGGALPPDTVALKQQFKMLLAALSESAASDQLFQRALDLLGDQFFAQLQMLPGAQFAATAGLEQINLETVLEKDPAAMCRVIQNDEGVAIEFPGNRVCGPHRIASVLRFVAGTARFAVRELPDVLKGQAKVVLARRLVREGLLTICAQSAVVEPALPGLAETLSPDGNAWSTETPAMEPREALESAR